MLDHLAGLLERALCSQATGAKTLQVQTANPGKVDAEHRLRILLQFQMTSFCSTVQRRRPETRVTTSIRPVIRPLVRLVAPSSSISPDITAPEKNGNQPTTTPSRKAASRTRLHINVADDNYQAYVAALTAAYVANKRVSLTYTLMTNGFCHILEFGVSG
jgi:hypothetical protein